MLPYRDVVWGDAHSFCFSRLSPHPPPVNDPWEAQGLLRELKEDVGEKIQLSPLLICVLFFGFLIYYFFPISSTFICFKHVKIQGSQRDMCIPTFIETKITREDRIDKI